MVFGGSADGYLLWVVFGLFVGVAMAIDLGAISQLKRRMVSARGNNDSENDANKEQQQQQAFASKENKGTFRQALTWTIVWISLACIFAAIIYATAGYGSFLEFVTGYTLEKSLASTTCLCLS